MGFRYRKSINLGGGTRLSISKSGFGLSTGIKGFRVGVGPRGVRTTASVPGTGISYTKQHAVHAAGPSRRRSGTHGIPITARETEDGKMAIEVMGETIREQRADKPVKLTTSDYKAGMKIAKRHARMNAKAAQSIRRGETVKRLLKALGVIAVIALIVGTLANMR